MDDCKHENIIFPCIGHCYCNDCGKTVPFLDAFRKRYPNIGDIVFGPTLPSDSLPVDGEKSNDE